MPTKGVTSSAGKQGSRPGCRRLPRPVTLVAISSMCVDTSTFLDEQAFGSAAWSYASPSSQARIDLLHRLLEPDLVSHGISPYRHAQHFPLWQVRGGSPTSRPAQTHRPTNAPLVMNYYSTAVAICSAVTRAAVHVCTSRSGSARPSAQEPTSSYMLHRDLVVQRCKIMAAVGMRNGRDVMIKACPSSTYLVSMSVGNLPI